MCVTTLLGDSFGGSCGGEAMMTTGPVAALACVTLKPQSLGEFGSMPSVFRTTAFPGILGNLVAVPRTPKPPSLASQDTWPKQATNG